MGAQHEPGHLFEIGVFKGRSASVLAAHRRPDERLILCDPSLAGGLPKGLNTVPAHALTLYAERSSFLPGKIADLARGVRFVSIDGEHSGRAVYNDLSIADAVLSDIGIVALDDFFSPQYPQITAATYDYLARHPYSFCLMLVGFLKGYLCRPAAYRHYQDLMVSRLPGLMAAAGAPVSLCKTGGPEDSFTFGLYPFREDLGTRHGPGHGRLQIIGTAEFRDHQP